MLQRDFADVIKVNNQLTLRKGAIPKKQKQNRKGLIPSMRSIWHIIADSET